MQQPVRRRVVTFVDEVIVPSPISSARSTRGTSPYRPSTAYPSIQSTSNPSQSSPQKSIKRQFIFKDPDEPSVTSSRIADEEIKELNNELGKAGVVIEVSQLGEIKESKGKGKRELEYFKMSFDDFDVDFSDRVSYLNLAKEPEVRLSARLKKPDDRRRMYDRTQNKKRLF
uniref:Uncharacterized protein n=1 Tax=Panagrolaimus davidi TaxID=227884 RepID=A0A914QDZ2_9BILA